MNELWLIWLIVSVGLFAIFERYALRHPDRSNTMSRSVALLGRKWPLSIAFVAMLFGGLLVHFYWPFCPFPS